MNLLKLSGWPFKKGEIARLLWIKSPYKNVNNEWMLPLYFKGQGGKVKRTETSWGCLPFIRFGQYFMDGRPFDVFKCGTLNELNIDNPSDGINCKTTDLPEGFLEEYKGLYLQNENLWCFNTNGKTVYISCMEIVRAFLVPNATLAKALLEPYGLSFLVKASKGPMNSIKLFLLKEVPEAIVTISFVKYLAWLMYDEQAKNLWDSMLTQIFPYGAIEEAEPDLFDNRLTSEMNKTIKAWPPLKGSSNWKIRCEEKNGVIFIYELLGFNNLELPFDKIYCEHEGIVSKTPGPKLKRSGLAPRKQRQQKENEIVITVQRPKRLINPKVVGITPTEISFSRFIPFSYSTREVKEPTYRRDPEFSKEPSNKTIIKVVNKPINNHEFGLRFRKAYE